MVRYYLVKGRVQGVGFRWFVQREAAELELRGWVRNTDAGHVEVVARVVRQRDTRDHHTNGTRRDREHEA